MRATVPMLRGVWGAALREVDRCAYYEFFEGTGPPTHRTPRYVMRACGPEVVPAPALEWILIGEVGAALPVLVRAWELAGERGLGPVRLPLRITRWSLLDEVSAAAPAGEMAGWVLARASWPLRGDPATTPCRLAFQSPTRLLRQGRLIEAPSLADLLVACSRRVVSLAPEGRAQELSENAEALIDLARDTVARPFEGRRLDVERYSGRQKRELELRGVVGHLDLPCGPGPLWPLLLAATWLHVGKGATIGMGHLRIDPLPPR